MRIYLFRRPAVVVASAAAILAGTTAVASADVLPASAAITGTTPPSSDPDSARLRLGSFVLQCQVGASFVTPASGLGPVPLTSIAGMGAPTFACTGGTIQPGVAPWQLAFVPGNPDLLRIGVAPGTQLNLGTACRVVFNPTTIDVPYDDGSPVLDVRAALPITRISGVCPASPYHMRAKLVLSQPLTITP
jgi:hypothetical protein